MRGFGWLAVAFASMTVAVAQDAEPLRIGVLLDTSAEMGFVVPLVRKERRLLDEELTAAGRPPLAYREMPGADLDRELTLSVAASRNAFFYLRDLFESEKADTILWISSFEGQQSGAGFQLVRELLEATPEGRPPRRLYLRNLWQEQIQKGENLFSKTNPLTVDPLDPQQRPESWYRLVEGGHGVVIRSWQMPPGPFRDQFGFPARVRGAGFLRAVGLAGSVAEFDTGWARDFQARHGLLLMRKDEEWTIWNSGREWLRHSTVLPFFDGTSTTDQNDALLASMMARDSIEEDLARIEAKRIGVLFAFGFVQRDLDRTVGTGTKRSDPVHSYYSDLAALAGEAKRHLDGPARSTTNRVYREQWIELDNPMRRKEGPDPIALAIARLAKEEGVDAIYLFTNGFTGGARYGTITIDEDVVARAAQETGVALHIRMPFETGSCPVSLERIALASGGQVFRGKQGDGDWDYPRPEAKWPEPDEAE